MKLTLKQITDATFGLKELSTLALPVKVAFRISRLIQAVEPILKTYEAKRLELLKKYATADGSNFKLTETQIPLFTEEHDQLLSVEEEVAFEPVKLDDGLAISARALVSLGKLVVE